MKHRMRPYLALFVAWEIVAAAGCLVGAAANGWGSLLPNLARYCLVGGVGVVALLAVAYSVDLRLHRRAGLLNETPRDR